MQNSEVQEILESYNNYISNLPTGIEGLIKNINDGNNTEVTNNLIELTEGINWLIQLKVILKNSFDIELFDEKELLEITVNINEALELGDFVLMTDILAYEMTPFIKKCNPVKLN